MTGDRRSRALRGGLVASFFQEHHHELVLAFNSGAIRPMRKAQIGATWALAARFLEKASVSQAVLPTGTGKTGVITALPLACAVSRLLVVVPSEIVRRQVQREFSTQRVLKSANAIPTDAGRPTVKALRRRISSMADWESLRAYDVVVATPQCISVKYKGVPVPPTDLFDQLIIDEAHHVAAPTWNAILDQFSGIPCAMLTATPVRRDRRQMPGEIVYVYSLHDAIADGIYWPIAFIPVRMNAGEAADEAIARVAIGRLRTPRHIAANSKLLVRTDRIDEAFRLRALYERLGISLPVLVSTLSAREADEIIKNIERGACSGVIVVGVLTEGFDLPQLKVAAYHAKHRSFAATLQFVGRLSRTLDDRIIEPELVALPDVLSTETKTLYAEDAAWSELLPDIADTAVEGERAARHYAASFTGVPEEFSLSALEPRTYARVYQLAADNNPDLFTGPKNVGSRPVWRTFSDAGGDLVAIITRSRLHPRWLRSDALDTEQYDLHLIFIDRERRLLFISSDTDASTGALLRHYKLTDALQLDGEELGKIVRSFEIEAFSSLGIRNDRLDASYGASYKALAGRAAERAITAADRLTASAGHAIGRFRDGQNLESIGAAFDSAKVWQSSNASLLAWKTWCEDIGSRLYAQHVDHAGVAGLALRHRVTIYPPDVICCNAPAELYILNMKLRTATGDIHIGECEIRARSAGSCVIVGIQYESTLLGTVAIDVNGNVTERHEIAVLVEDEELPLSAVLEQYPIALVFSDGTSVVRGRARQITALNVVPADVMESWDWDGVDVSAESSDPDGGKINILSRTIAEYLFRYPNAYIIVDDAAHELADVLILREVSARRIEVNFVHCKWSSAAKPGHRLSDIYEVLAQASRSVRWTLSQLFVSELIQRLANRAATIVANGDKATLLALLNALMERGSRKMLYFSITAVQPGLLIRGLSGWPSGSNMIASAASWCEEQGVTFTMCGSE